MKINYSYLPRQFKNTGSLWKKLKKFVSTGDFTLGKELKIFEKNFAKLIGVKYAIGVNSGTDALKLALKAIGVKPGDEVITAANTFVATVGAIEEIGAKIKFVDCDDTFCIDTSLIEKNISKKTKAIVPVHYTGNMPNMKKLKTISKKYKIPIIEDACQSILGEYDKKKSGTWGEASAFSFHPLKNINVWSDGGMVVTNSKKIFDKISLLRNHGLIDRDTVKILGYNSRLDTFQAVVGNWLLPKAKSIAEKRIKNAKYFDREFSKIHQVTIPPRLSNVKHVYHLYIIFVKNRDRLYKHCLKKGIEVKIHYPTPIYRQTPFLKRGLKKGMFPVTDEHTKKIISFPCDQHLLPKEKKYIVNIVRNFYRAK